MMEISKKVDVTVYLINKAVEVLNLDYQTIQSKKLQVNLPTKAFILLSLYNEDDSWFSYNKEVKDMILNEIKVSKNLNQQQAEQYLSEVLKELDKIVFVHNLVDIDRYFDYDTNREFKKNREYLLKYITFSNGEFKLISDYQKEIKRFYNI